MNCIKCGKENNEGDKFCSSCGATLIQKEENDSVDTTNTNQNVIINNHVQKVGQKPFSAFAITGFVLSLVAFFILPLIVGTPGLIFSCISFNDIKDNNKSGTGLAVAGLILGIIDVIWGIVALIR